MPFTQKDKLCIGKWGVSENIPNGLDFSKKIICRGCDENCEIYANKTPTEIVSGPLEMVAPHCLGCETTTCVSYTPMIGKSPVYKYTNNMGERIVVGIDDTNQSEMVKFAYIASRFCDNYNKQR